MAFEKKDWQDGETIQEADLDRMEAGIEGAYVKTVTVTVDNNIGVPSATGTYSAGTLTLDFKNLKGAKGDTGAKGDAGAQGPAGAGLTGSAVAITPLEGTEEAAAIATKVNEIITQLKARGVTS